LNLAIPDFPQADEKGCNGGFAPPSRVEINGEIVGSTRGYLAPDDFFISLLGNDRLRRWTKR
jgi:hypothetical protein